MKALIFILSCVLCLYAIDHEVKIIAQDFENENIIVDVCNEIGVCHTFKGVSLVMLKNGIFYVSNRHRCLGMFPKVNYSVIINGEV